MEENHGELQASVASPWRTYAAILSALVVTGWLSTWRLVSVAESLPLGHGRDVAVAGARALDDAAGLAGLDRPSRFVMRAIGRTPPPSANDAAKAVPTGSAGPVAAVPPDEFAAPGGTPNPVAFAPRTPTKPKRATVVSRVSAPPGKSPRRAATVVATGTTKRPTGVPTAADIRLVPTEGAGPAATPLPRNPVGQAPTPLSRKPVGPAWPGDTPVPSPTPRTARGGARRPGPTAVGNRPTEAAATVTATPPGRPIYVLVAGDSLAEPLGYEMRTIAAQDGLIRARLEFRISSGLARPDYFDWNQYLTGVIAEFPPDVVIWHSGGNDGQNLEASSGIVTVGSAPWQVEYQARVAKLMDIATSTGSRLYWLGLPPVRDAELEVAAKAINKAAQLEAATRPRVSYVDLAAMFAGPEGQFTAFMAGSDGTTTRVRQEDGVHLTREGTNWVADLVYGRILADAGLERPPTP